MLIRVLMMVPSGHGHWSKIQSSVLCSLNLPLEVSRIELNRIHHQTILKHSTLVLRVPPLMRLILYAGPTASGLRAFIVNGGEWAFTKHRSVDTRWRAYVNLVKQIQN